MLLNKADETGRILESGGENEREFILILLNTEKTFQNRNSANIMTQCHSSSSCQWDMAMINFYQLFWDGKVLGWDINSIPGFSYENIIERTYFQI